MYIYVRIFMSISVYMFHKCDVKVLYNWSLTQERLSQEFKPCVSPSEAEGLGDDFVGLEAFHVPSLSVSAV